MSVINYLKNNVTATKKLFAIDDTSDISSSYFNKLLNSKIKKPLDLVKFINKNFTDVKYKTNKDNIIIGNNLIKFYYDKKNPEDSNLETRYSTQDTIHYEDKNVFSGDLSYLIRDRDENFQGLKKKALKKSGIYDYSIVEERRKLCR